MNEQEHKEFFEKLLKRKANTFTLSFVYQSLSSEIQTDPPPLTDLLSIDHTLLTEEGRSAIEFLETVKGEEERFSFEKFKWKVIAFLSVQDVLTAPLFPDTTNENILRLKYFYYESKYILIEIIVSSFNGLHIANKQLLRNFLEFNLQQCYYINKIKKETSYQSLNQYIDTKINPSLSKLIKEAIPNDNFCKSIKKRIQVEFEHLSNRYSHAYNQQESPKHDSIYRPGLTIESLYFYIQVMSVLDSVLWLYFVNFPLLFKPVDIVRKFAFSPPALFVPPGTTAVIQKAILKDDFTAFETYADNSEEVKGYLEWYNSLDNLSDEQIWEQYDKEREENDTIDTCFIKSIATYRAVSEMLINTKKMEEELNKKADDVNDLLLDTYSSFSK